MAAAAANAAPGGAATAIRAVADGGRLATITSDPPRQERGITVANVYVRSDGALLRQLTTHFAAGRTAHPRSPLATASRMPPRRSFRQPATHTPGAITVTPRP